jgi:hypothetical protein
MLFIGQRVRCFDFKPTRETGESYVEGYVKRIRNNLVEITVNRDIRGGIEARPPTNRVGSSLITPMPGKMRREWEGRITVLEPEEFA